MTLNCPIARYLFIALDSVDNNSFTGTKRCWLTCSYFIMYYWVVESDKLMLSCFEMIIQYIKKINGVSSLSEIKDAYKKHGPGKTIFFPSVWRICRYWSSFAVYRWRARFVLLNKVILHGPSTTLECPVCFVMRYCSPSPIVKNPKNTILPYLLIINGIHKTLKTCLCTK